MRLSFQSRLGDKYVRQRGPDQGLPYHEALPGPTFLAKRISTIFNLLGVSEKAGSCGGVNYE